MLGKNIISFPLFHQRLKPLVSQKIFQFILFFPPILQISVLFLLFFLLKQLPPEVPLYYSKPWGTDQLTSPFFLFLLPIGSLLWYFLTLLFITITMHQYRIFAQLMLTFTFLVSTLSALTILNILFLIL